jgi:DNA repair protein RadA/Sms
MAKTKSVFFCTECGNETIKWQGQCPSCKSWNTVVEQPAVSNKQVQRAFSQPGGKGYANREAVRLSDVDITAETRFLTGIGELDRVLGGGAVNGSLVLVGGSPGIGKSTLLLQLCGHASEHFKVMYVTGEESGRQLKMRAKRLGLDGGDLLVLAETNLNSILDGVYSVSPDILIVDSIQTIYNDGLESSPGSVGQVRDCALALMQLAKNDGVTVFIVGHINKEGSIAGPKVLEHMVDCVLYFEGEQSAGYRILRATKNRFGSTNEIGVFEMTEDGLRDVPNPSEMLLSGRPKNASGTCVTCLMEGSRPVLAEIQALIAPTGFNVPRRMSNGIDYNRAMLLLAVLEKKAGFRLSASDAYINVIGGLNINETAADIAAMLAIASSYLDKPVADDLAAIGEAGLTGEVRSVSHIEQRLSEIRRLGFYQCIVPALAKGKYRIPKDLNIIEVKTIREAIAKALGV